MSYAKCFIRLCILLAATLALVACGGGNGAAPAPGPQTWFFPEGAALTDSQINSFDTQGLYFNVHSAANPGGEIRSQIIPSATTFITDKGNPVTTNNFSALLSGAQEVPANTSRATGYSTIALDPVAKTISGVVVTSGIVGTVAHIHDGLPGISGPPVITLAGGPTVWTVPAGTVLNDAQIARLTAGAYYVNVHTTQAPDGEIRGQLNQQLRFALLIGANEVPPVTTSASGTGVLALNPTTNQISGFVKTTGIVGRVAHIHEAAAGVNGGVIVPLTETPAGSGVWVVPAGQALTAGQAASFNAGNLYYNVHSDANPGGEIRGQILASTVKIGNAALDGTKEVPPVTTGAGGTGIMTLNSVTKQVNGNIKTTGIAGTLAHVHEATAGVNGSIIIPLTLTPPASTFQAPLAISTTTLVNGSVGVAYSQSLTATGGVAPYTWTIDTGTLPAGLSLNAAGTISGTPTAAGTASFTVRVTDSASPAATKTQALSLTITPQPAATVSFATQIQPIFTANCTVNCHSPGGTFAALNLTAGNSFASLVQSNPPRVIPGSSATSLLYLRVSGVLLPRMPLGLPPLSAADQTLIQNWIDQGASNN
jgi:CHRD domain-containing protein/putative Ig domain-containing protein